MTNAALIPCPIRAAINISPLVATAQTIEASR
jgi:hypothetical protein